MYAKFPEFPRGPFGKGRSPGSEELNQGSWESSAEVGQLKKFAPQPPIKRAMDKQMSI